VSRKQKAGLIVLVAVAAWWILLGVGAGLGEGRRLGGALVLVLFPGGIFAATLLLSLRFLFLGGLLAFIEGLVVFAAYPWIISGGLPLPPTVFVLSTMALPPLIAGNLLLFEWSSRRPGRVGD
jgi:hypothetical protein